LESKKTALITGATSGIGSVVVDHIVSKGYDVIILARSVDKLNSLVARLKNDHQDAIVEGIECDLSSFKTVSEACKSIKENHDRLDLLILNAGLWNFQFTQTDDGIEETLHVNLISQVQLFNELIELVPKNHESKVIFTSSGLHQGKINFEDIEFRNNFSGFKSYRQSKLGSLMLTRWLAKQDEYEGISFYCVHPGMVNTNLGRNAGWLSRSIFKFFGKSKKNGASTHLHLIDTPNSELRSGEYYANSKVTRTTRYSYDLNEAEKLWNIVNEYIR
jgi:NAD(P)-dependent dehydrogenase (short-subunit alcohol dehydrogenase family)